MTNSAAPTAKKSFKTPHTFVILVGLIVITVLLTYVVPAGKFERMKDETSGRTLVVPGTFKYVDSHPFSIAKIPGVLHRGAVDAADIVIFVLLIGGAFEIINRTGALMALSCKVARVCRGKRELLVVPFFMILFSIFGTTMGMSAEVMVFVPIGIAVAKSLGYDRVTGTAMIGLGALVGFTAGIYNPFSVGIAQSIAELPLFSGAPMRYVLLAVLIAVSSIYIQRYTNRVKKDPTKSILYGIDDEYDNSQGNINVEMTKSHVGILLAMLAGLAVLIIGVSTLDFWFEEMCAIFVVMGAASGAIARYSPSKIATYFAIGAKEITAGALTVGFARAIQVVMTDGIIIDSIVNSMAIWIQMLPSAVQALGIYLVQNFVNVIIISGSGQAVVTMPIMVPIADLIGMSRQTAVLAFQMGDGFTTAILPTSAATMGYLSAAKIPYSRWLKFVVPLVGIWFVIGGIFMIAAIITGY